MFSEPGRHATFRIYDNPKAAHLIFDFPGHPVHANDRPGRGAGIAICCYAERWRRLRDLNPRSPDYQTGALCVGYRHQTDDAPAPGC